MKYKDLFVDFDDTLYDTHGNAVIALGETFDMFHLERYFADPQVFYDAYWMANIDLWTRYSKGEITRDYPRQNPPHARSHPPAQRILRIPY